MTNFDSGCHGPLRQTEAEAITAWNIRAALAKRGLEVREIEG